LLLDGLIHAESSISLSGSHGHLARTFRIERS
jgi:hypothetical protein